jgi:hypothetical protein
MTKDEFEQYIEHNKEQIESLKQSFNNGNYINPFSIIEKLEEVNKLLFQTQQENKIKEHLKQEHLEEIKNYKYLNLIKDKTKKNYIYKIIMFYKRDNIKSLEPFIINFIKECRRKENISILDVENFI